MAINNCVVPLYYKITLNNCELLEGTSSCNCRCISIQSQSKYWIIIIIIIIVNNNNNNNNSENSETNKQWIAICNSVLRIVDSWWKSEMCPWKTCSLIHFECDFQGEIQKFPHCIKTQQLKLLSCCSHVMVWIGLNKPYESWT